MAILATTTSKNANLLIGYLSNVPEGYSVSREEITKATGVDVSTSNGNAVLKTARDAMFQQAGILFKFISGRLTRLNDEEKIAEGVRKDAQAGNMLRQARDYVMSIDDYAMLSADAKETHTRVVTKSVVMAHISKPLVLNELAEKVKSRGGSGMLSGRDFLNMLSATASV